ncbi:hypothetical protein C3B43_27710, partial [Mycobacterium kansasii]
TNQIGCDRKRDGVGRCGSLPTRIKSAAIASATESGAAGRCQHESNRQRSQARRSRALRVAANTNQIGSDRKRDGVGRCGSLPTRIK